MNHKGKLVVAALLSFIAVIFDSNAQTFGVQNDLWDIHQGTTVTYTTGVQGSTTDPGMFGGSDGGTITTHFADNRPNGFVHVIEWRTTSAVTVGRIALWAAGDGATFNNGREFARFTLKVKTPGSSTFDRTVYSFTPTHPYTYIGDKKILDAVITPITAQEFRGEFEQINLRGSFDGPRVIELDAYPPTGPTPPVVTITSPSGGSIGTSSVILSGSITTTNGVASARWERNGVAIGALSLNNGQFSQTVNLVEGENRLRVIGVDSQGLEGSAEVVVTSNIAYGVSDDLFDVSQGTILGATSGLQSSTSDPGMLGGQDFAASPFTTQFADDKPNGFAHYAEWRTASAVSVSQIKLYAAGDGAIYSNGPEFAKFTLKAKSAGSSTYDKTILSFTPTHPYTYISGVLVLDTNFPAITAQEFRGEFEQINLRADGWNAPRVIEIDAFGPPPAPEPVIFQQPSSVAVLPGGTATFSVAVSGASPLSYFWNKDTNDIILSSRIESTDGKTLLIKNVTAADVGAYSVLVTNQHGSAQSASANLTLIIDTNAPIVVITAPTNGISGSKSVTLEGSISDNYGVASARWEKNGSSMGSLILSNGLFSVKNIALGSGETRLKVIASDSTGNEGSAEVVLVLSPNAQSDVDLWDISRGTVVTRTTGVYTEQGGPGLFGGDGFVAELGSTVFTDDQTNGFVHEIEWRTVSPVTISTIRIFAGGDGEIYSHGREMGRFTLKAKSPGSSTFDVSVFTYIPPHPYVEMDAESSLILETNVPAFAAQEFKGEFEQINLRTAGYNAPRVIELDAFGPSSAGAPEIVIQPAAKEGFAGANVSFLVGVTGSSPLSYQWKHDGTNITNSAHFSGVNSWSLTIKNIQAEDAGNYSVLVTNPLGETNSANALLTVSVDSTPPVVVISTPSNGSQTNGTIVLSGTVSDANGIASVTYEHNGRVARPIPLTNGKFSLASLNLDLGDNVIKVTATDLSGNVGAAEVISTWTVPRALVLGTPPPTQDGLRLTVPVLLVSTGGVSGATFSVTFDTNYLADLQVEWKSATDTAFTSANLETPRRLRATFALPGTTLSAGSLPIASLSFRARSVPTNILTQLKLELTGIYSDTGDPYESNNSVLSTVASITRRKFIGDNNANDRLDVGDASTILRLVTGIEFPRPWDRTLNDLNRNGNVDSGDVIRVLRAVVELDPQPTNALSQAPLAMSTSKSIAKAGSSVQLVADKATAAPGEKVTVEVRLADQTKLVTGVSFRLDYPVDALRIANSSSHTLGSIVPAGAAQIWNLAPNQNNYTTQNGSIALGASTPTTWPSSNGVLARITFTVQEGAAGAASWPVRLSNVVIAREGGLVESATAADWSFIPRIPPPIKLSPSIEFIAGVPRLTLQGDVGATYRIEASSNLSNWQTVGTYVAANGSVVIDDTLAAGATQRFYRAVLQ